jgi:hypothetical protein
MKTAKTIAGTLAVAVAALLAQGASAADVSNPVKILDISDGFETFGHLVTGNNSGNTFTDKYAIKLTESFSISADVYSRSGTASNGLAISSLDLYNASGLVAHGQQLSDGAVDQWLLNSAALVPGQYFLQVSGSVLSNAAGRYSSSATLQQVSAVPEPATVGMLLGGLGLVGALSRRKRQQGERAGAV